MEVGFFYGDVREVDIRPGADLSGADLRGATLRGATLRGATLRGADLRGADLEDADLEDAGFQGADLEGANLDGANIRSARFVRAVLRRAEFGELRARIPAVPGIHSAVYQSALSVGLNMRVWDSGCGSAKCWAGWVVYHAGAAGAELQGMVGYDAAAALILIASDPKLERIPDWYQSDDYAIEAMRRLAKGAA